MDSKQLKQIIQTKTSTGDLYQTTIEGVSIIYRLLTPLEIQYINEYVEKGITPGIIDETIVALTVIKPVDLQFKLPGSISGLANTITQSSIVTSDTIEEKVKELRRTYSKDKLNFGIHLALSIASSVQNVNLLELLNSPISQLMKTAVILEEYGDMQIFNIERKGSNTQKDIKPNQQYNNLKQNKDMNMPSPEEMDALNKELLEQMGY